MGMVITRIPGPCKKELRFIRQYKLDNKAFLMSRLLLLAAPPPDPPTDLSMPARKTPDVCSSRIEE